MSWYTNIVKSGVKTSPSLGTLTLTGTNETLKVTTPSAMSAALLQGQKMSQMQPTNEVWLPFGIWYTVTTTVAAAAGVVVLRKNGVSAATGGFATIPAVANATTVLFAPFTAWTFAAAPAAADQWSVLVTTITDTTGIINPIILAYVTGAYLNVSDGIAM